MDIGIAQKSTGALDVERTLPPVLPIGAMTEQWYGDNKVAKDLKDQWIENGFSILRGAYSAEEIKAYNDIVARVRTEVEDGKNEYGHGDRIGQLHQKEPDLLNLAVHPEVLGFLQWAFNDEPVLFGSLNFERGTQQDAHIDAIFFWPEPTYSMAGCWIALEDIHIDAGPLFYVPNSHKWPFYTSEHVVNGRPELAERRLEARAEGFPEDQKGKLVSDLGVAWTEDLRHLEKVNQTERKPISLKAGDVVFWHSLLAHGGSPVANPALSRRSVVFHYIGKNTKLYTFDQFMLHDRADLPNLQEQPKNLKSFNGKLEYMSYPYFVTYANGQQVHPLEETN
ncbi:phytanoyl-CoA dioxygenase family protein [Methylobacterium radiotolerans]|uniref:phytanoyl-CoA dioxygenase family protein n=1 Tax=Methylobacterium radiotolerans TaxID=31998 RepID=UPI0010581548|nr:MULTISPECIES: phytanoyl-CoA dioxygenase family protein [Methylobacterium]MDE3750354.1 phytanoyl-CoA dioxygenase family protein [Methylobacterium radiotolerans]